MKHCGTQTIETERLILRQFKSEDADAMFKNWANDEEVTKYLTWPPHGTVDVTKEILKQWVDSYKNEKYYQWAIVLKEIDEPPSSKEPINVGELVQIETNRKWKKNRTGLNKNEENQQVIIISASFIISIHSGLLKSPFCLNVVLIISYLLVLPSPFMSPIISNL